MNSQPEIKIDIEDFTITGAFMVALTRLPPAQRPTDVAGFVGALADYGNRHGAALNSGAGLTTAPDIIPGALPAPGPYAAQFDAGSDGIGIWQVAGLIALRNVAQGAAMAFVQNTAQNVVLRLPETGNIAAKETVANTLDSTGGRFEALPFLGPYETGDITSLQFVWANVGDYTTRSCR